MLKRTPLYAVHQKLGGKLIEFGGWEMPVQYSSIVDEHLAVRRAGGLFDISHMGEVFVSGPGALSFLNQALTNDLRKLAPGQGQYTLMCNERGGTIDDLYAYRLAELDYLLIINASRIEADVAWLENLHRTSTHAAPVQWRNASAEMAAVALQGPRVRSFINEVFTGPFTGGTPIRQASDLKKNEITETSYQNRKVYLGCTGYTGEDGFEIVAPSEAIEPIWTQLLAAGHAHCLQPAGLGARDTLRTEVCYPLYGHELDENTTPLEAGLGFFVALEKGEFVGRSVLADQKAHGTTRRCVAFKMTGKSAPPRPHYAIWSPGPDGVRLGEVVSGTQSPSLSLGIGLGYVPTAQAKAGTALEIEIRSQRAPAVIVPKPIFKKA